ncbi:MULTISPECIES: hypothetical protein [unclassified Rhizobium]|uniref:hypothetical protein n=1 Tax=unclassified Rhizobium TaxID=2613769 RepID=UPI001622E3F6|nr:MULTISPECIES: hypothetical protein [unclassified Rhizobium]MBB3385531.1 hypothetical protein [Rhizobium sp. BK098]MBB3617236.1 hypothetical protein [Rhizobium sp. BK609]MBB3682928.1 hypothetical protein [Rhizobium sp. BK612]
MNEKNKSSARPLRFASRLWALLGLVSWWLAMTPEAYVAMFMIIGAVFAVGDEILNELRKGEGANERG